MSEAPRDTAATSQAMDAVDAVLLAPPRDLGGGFMVRRALPSPARRLVGPFAFFDEFGPVVFPPGQGLDVRPHPHIALATLTYLFDGEILHRDSLGSVRVIQPGDVNWMVAGRGIVHSERTPPARRASGGPLFGIQCWVGLPRALEDTAPAFQHHDAATIPEVALPGVRLRIIAGASFGVTSPVRVLSPTLYAHARLEAGAALPLDAGHAERAVYVVEGDVTCGGRRFGPGTLVTFHTGASASLHAETAASVMILGGAPLDGPRHIEWNFVGSSHELVAAAKEDWRRRNEARFPLIPGDELEFIPLPP